MIMQMIDWDAIADLVIAPDDNILALFIQILSIIVLYQSLINLPEYREHIKQFMMDRQMMNCGRREL